MLATDEIGLKNAPDLKSANSIKTSDISACICFNFHALAIVSH